MGSKKHILKEAFVGALLVASIIVILKHFDLLDRIKIITLNAVSSTVATEFSGDAIDKNEAPFSKKIENNTSLLVIDQINYEVNFNQSSPLDRKLLAQYIKEISELNPEILAIDLDLSPNPNILVTDEELLEKIKDCDKALDEIEVCDEDLRKALEGHSSGDKTLKEVLKEISKKIKVVLLFPEPVESIAVRQKKIEWIQDLLKDSNGNLYFSLGTIFEQDGMSLKFINYPSMFAKTIYNIYKNENGGSLDDLKSFTNEIIYNRDLLNKLINKPLRDSYLFNIKNIYGEHLEQYNAIYNKSLNHISRKISKLSDLKKVSPEKIIILGTDYGETDHFKTLMNVQPGVFLHYAALYSLENPIEHRPYIDFFIEILVGMALGICLHWIMRIDFLMEHFLLRLIPIILVALFMLLIMYISKEILLNFNFWINPGPIFFGIMIHELVNYIKEKKEIENSYLKIESRHNIYKTTDEVSRKIFVYSIPLFAILFLIIEIIFH